MPLLQFNSKGIFCKEANIYIDPWRPVEKALITHAHSDHARYGMGSYLTHHHTVPILKHRLGASIVAQGIGYSEPLTINNVKFSFHPAGHTPGSSQIRVEHKGEVWVVSGDYKTEDDGLSRPFEVVPCHTFITESTFGLPIFQWPTQKILSDEINAWWRKNQGEGRVSVLFAYSLGKAQRILSMIDPTIGPIYGHGAVESLTTIIRDIGYPLPAMMKVPARSDKKDLQGSLVIAPPSAAGTPWMKRFLPYAVAAASGWMSLRGVKRRKGYDRGFIVSDHADFASLNHAVRTTGAEKVLVTHGYTASYARWLRDQGLDAEEVQTEYKGEVIQEEEEPTSGGEEV